MDDRYDDSLLRRQIDDLRRRLDTVRKRVDALPVAADLDKQRREIDERHRELSRSVDEAVHGLGRRLDELEQEFDQRFHTLSSTQAEEFARRDRRLHWLERRVRAASATPTTRLDPTPDLLALARRAERGKTLSAQLLDLDTRTAKDHAVTAWESWQAAHRKHTALALAASRTIAATEPDQLGRPATDTAYRTARAALADLAARRDTTRQSAIAATQQLTRDDTLRRTYATDIAEGEQAWTALTTRLRTQLTDSIERDELLPVWFDTALGMGPPPDADPWLQAGTELLAYRITYGVDDSIVALGPAPDARSSDRRREWHRRLAGLLGTFR